MKILKLGDIKQGYLYSLYQLEIENRGIATGRFHPLKVECIAIKEVENNKIFKFKCIKTGIYLRYLKSMYNIDWYIRRVI